MKKITFIFMLLSLLTGCAEKAETSAPIPEKNPATIPTEKLDREWWAERHQNIIDNNQSSPHLILVGDSILHSLDDPSRQQVWEEYLDQYSALNLGFSGDRTENVIWRLQNGEIEGINPKVALLLIGTNNTDGNHFLSITPPEALAEGIWEICSVLRNKLPDTRILLLGILPYGYTPNFRDVINKETNQIISGFPAKDSYIHYRDIGPVFLDSESRVDKALMPDFLHPNTEGHLKMFEALEKDIADLMALSGAPEDQ